MPSQFLKASKNYILSYPFDFLRVGKVSQNVADESTEIRLGDLKLLLEHSSLRRIDTFTFQILKARQWKAEIFPVNILKVWPLPCATTKSSTLLLLVQHASTALVARWEEIGEAEVEDCARVNVSRAHKIVKWGKRRVCRFNENKEIGQISETQNVSLSECFTALFSLYWAASRQHKSFPHISQTMWS